MHAVEFEALEWGKGVEGGLSRNGHLGLTRPVTGRRSRRVEMMGARYAKVLPLPVSAARTTLRPPHIAGMLKACLACISTDLICTPATIAMCSPDWSTPPRLGMLISREC